MKRRPYSIHRLLSTEGFTLLELLVVVLMIAVLMAIAAPSFLGHTKKAQDSVAKQNLSLSWKAARDAATSNPSGEGLYPAASDLLSGPDSIGSSEPALIVSAGGYEAAFSSSSPSHIYVSPAPSDGGLTTSTTYVAYARSDSGAVFCITAPNAGQHHIYQTASDDCSGDTTLIVDPLCPDPGVDCVPPNNVDLPVLATIESGASLSTNDGSWTGTEVINYTYRWQACDPDTGSCSDSTSPSAAGWADTGETTATADLPAGALLKRACITGANAWGIEEVCGVAYSTIGGDPPHNTVRPVAQQVLEIYDAYPFAIGDKGEWTGSEPIVYTYQWQTCDTTSVTCAATDDKMTNTDWVSDTNQTYDTDGSLPDLTQYKLRVCVTGENSHGSDTRCSLPLADGVPVFNISKPSAGANCYYDWSGGAPVCGSDPPQLSADDGDWGGTPPITIHHVWQDCNNSTPGNCHGSDIAGDTDWTVIGSQDDGWADYPATDHWRRICTTASNEWPHPSGTEITICSSPIVGVDDGSPVQNVVAPAIANQSDSLQKLLITSYGTWTGSLPVVYPLWDGQLDSAIAYHPSHWQDCNTATDDCSASDSFTDSAWANLTASDYDPWADLPAPGYARRLCITAYNFYGPSTTFSEDTACSNISTTPSPPGPVTNDPWIHITPSMDYTAEATLTGTAHVTYANVPSGGVTVPYAWRTTNTANYGWHTAPGGSGTFHLPAGSGTTTITEPDIPTYHMTDTDRWMTFCIPNYTYEGLHCAHPVLGGPWTDIRPAVEPGRTDFRVVQTGYDDEAPVFARVGLLPDSCGSSCTADDVTLWSNVAWGRNHVAGGDGKVYIDFEYVATHHGPTEQPTVNVLVQVTDTSIPWTDPSIAWRSCRPMSWDNTIMKTCSLDSSESLPIVRNSEYPNPGGSAEIAKLSSGWAGDDAYTWVGTYGGHDATFSNFQWSLCGYTEGNDYNDGEGANKVCADVPGGTTATLDTHNVNTEDMTPSSVFAAFGIDAPGSLNNGALTITQLHWPLQSGDPYSGGYITSKTYYAGFAREGNGTDGWTYYVLGDNGWWYDIDSNSKYNTHYDWHPVVEAGVLDGVSWSTTNSRLDHSDTNPWLEVTYTATVDGSPTVVHKAALSHDCNNAPSLFPLTLSDGSLGHCTFED